MWRHIAQSLQGPSHLQDGTPCQDSHGVCIVGEGASSTLIACVADGAGTAKHSEVGSRTACDAFLEHAARFLETNAINALTIDDTLLWCDDIRDRIKQQANEKLAPFRSFATTLVAAIVGPECSAFLQIGDGAIVVGTNNLCGVVFWPQSGEYVNTTNFITTDEYHQRLQYVSARISCSRIALMTDGLERLALRFDAQIPHMPFFDPLFRVLQSREDLPILNEGLREFLSSDSIHHRTDDDKTLVLATRCADDAA